MARRDLGLLVALCAFSLVLNVGYMILMDGWLTITGDAVGYDAGARVVAEGGGISSAKREPGYYVFLGGVYHVFGARPLAGRLAQGVLASSFCLLVFAIARPLVAARVLPAHVPFVAAALTAAYPGFIFYAGTLHREILLTFLFLLSLVFLTRHLLGGRAVHAVVYGALTGVAALVDGRVLFFPLFLALVAFVRSRDWRRAARFVALTFGMALLVIAPWSARSSLLEHRFVLLATSPYKGLLLVTGPEEMLEWHWDQEPLRSLQKLPNGERERALERLALENLRKYPGHYLMTTLPRFFRLWLGGHSNVVPSMDESLTRALGTGEWGYAAAKTVLLGINLAYVIGGAVGAVLFARGRAEGPVLHLLAFPVYLSLMHMLLFATPRYHIPAVPALIVFLAYLLGPLVDELTWKAEAPVGGRLPEAGHGRS